MTYSLQGDSVQIQANIEDVKLVYRTLHKHLSENLDLMDCDLFDALQGVLQKKAQSDGVDIGNHSAWDLWLGNVDTVPCEERVRKRKNL